MDDMTIQITIDGYQSEYDTSGFVTVDGERLYFDSDDKFYDWLWALEARMSGIVSKPSRWDGMQWAEGHRYGTWRPAVNSTEDRIVSSVF